MHYGKLDGPNDTAARRVYRHLNTASTYRVTHTSPLTARDAGGWLSSWDLATAARTPCPGTRVSEVRAQLPAHETIETRRVGNVWYYRLVRTEETGDE